MRWFARDFKLEFPKRLKVAVVGARARAKLRQWRDLVRSMREWVAEGARRGSVAIPDRIGLAGSMPARPRRPEDSARSHEQARLNKSTIEDGRGDWIRTSDLLLPKQTRYQAALRPDDMG